MSRLPTPATARSAAAWAVPGALLGLVAAVLLTAPAHWLAGAVRAATDGRVVLEDARGTVWNGSARLVLAGGSGSRDAAALPSPLVWALRPQATGLRLALQSACCTMQPLVLRLQPRWGGGALRVEDGPPSLWPAALLAGLGTPWNTLQLDGEFQLQSRGLSLESINRRLQLGGRAELSALRLSSRLSTLRPMGSYRLTVEAGGGGAAAIPTLRLDTLDGSLRLDGTGQWVGGRLRFAGEATATPEHEAALANLLNIIGRRNGARSTITIG